MKESYGEDLASHTDPESCTVAREGGREALTGVCAGELLSREITCPGCRRCFQQAEGHIPCLDLARGTGTPRGRRPSACTETPHARTGRSRVRPSDMARRAALGSLRTQANDERTREV